MINLPSRDALVRIKEHIDHSRSIVRKFARNNFPRVQTVYEHLSTTLRAIYQAGEGWIEEDVHRILNTIEFAAYKHQTQLRKDKTQTSYIVHLLSVADHLLLIGNVRNPDLLIASLLHDTLEDTETSYEELVDKFGKPVADLVQEVTDDTNLAKEERKRLQVVRAPHTSAGAAQIKLADKWNNLKDILQYPPLEWSEQRIEDYFTWAQQVIQALPWVNANLLQAAQEVIEEFYKSKF